MKYTKGQRIKWIGVYGIENTGTITLVLNGRDSKKKWQVLNVKNDNGLGTYYLQSTNNTIKVID